MNNHSDAMGNMKKSVLEFPETKPFDLQAAEWLAKLDNTSPSEEDIRSFKRWVHERPEHKQAFEELNEFWGELNVLTQAVGPRETIHRTSSQGRLSFFFGFNVKTAACVACLLLMTISVLSLNPNIWQQGPTVHETALGEQKTIELPDHTIVFLNTNSTIEVLYNDKKRRVRLVKGEAHFDVFHNPDKPFEVFAGNRLVRAIGTAFNVHIREVEVEVIVTEGTVEIDKADPLVFNVSIRHSSKADPNITNAEAQKPAVTNVRVKAGNAAKYDPEQLDQIKLMVTEQVEEKLSWRQGILVFSGEPLAQVVEEISRYTSLKIVIPEKETQQIKIGGHFKIGDTESLFEALRYGFDIQVKYTSENTVYLTRKDDS